MEYHTPVLLEESIALLKIRQYGVYIDATLGGGGHFRAILSKLQEGVCIGIDMDTDSIQVNSTYLGSEGYTPVYTDPVNDYSAYKKDNMVVILYKSNFKSVRNVIRNVSAYLQKELIVSGIVFDLGISSYQIDTIERGFSYQHDASLDMRMDKQLSVKAEDLVNALYKDELELLLRTYGEELFAKRIAQAIVRERRKKYIKSSGELTRIIKSAVPVSYRKPYAKTFQALRIKVNDEFNNLESAVQDVDTILESDGTAVFISFHSLEDKIVKEHFIGNSMYKSATAPVYPSPEEIERNKRARSAVLRAFIKN